MPNIVANKVEGFVGIHNVTSLFVHGRLYKEEADDAQYDAPGAVAQPGQHMNGMADGCRKMIDVYALLVTPCYAIQQLNHRRGCISNTDTHHQPLTLLH